MGSSELTHMALAMIIWVISDMLVQGRKTEEEVRSFV